jgi:hypothetical protein
MKIGMMNVYHDDEPWQSRAENESSIPDSDTPLLGNGGARSIGFTSESGIASVD